MRPASGRAREARERVRAADGPRCHDPVPRAPDPTWDAGACAPDVGRPPPLGGGRRSEAHRRSERKSRLSLITRAVPALRAGSGHGPCARHQHDRAWAPTAAPHRASQPRSSAPSGPAGLAPPTLGVDTMSPDGLPEALLEAALHYARQGWPVLPLHSVREGRCSCGRDCDRAAGKHPRSAHGVRDASVDEAVVRAWWARWPDANLGLATGHASGLVVLDIDPAHGGEESLEALVARHGPPPRGPIARHRRRGAAACCSRTRDPACRRGPARSDPGSTSAATAATSSRLRAGIVLVASTSGTPGATPMRFRSPRRRPGSWGEGLPAATPRAARYRRSTTRSPRAAATRRSRHSHRAIAAAREWGADSGPGPALAAVKRATKYTPPLSAKRACRDRGERRAVPGGTGARRRPSRSADPSSMGWPAHDAGEAGGSPPSTTGERDPPTRRGLHRQGEKQNKKPLPPLRVPGDRLLTNRGSRVASRCVRVRGSCMSP